MKVIELCSSISGSSKTADKELRIGLKGMAYPHMVKISRCMLVYQPAGVDAGVLRSFE